MCIPMIVARVTSESESSSSMPSLSSVSRGLKPSLFLPRRPPTPQSLALGRPSLPAGPRPRLLHRRTARHRATTRESGTEMAAATSTELLTPAVGRRGEEGAALAWAGLGGMAGREEEGLEGAPVEG